jgi:hypothetical protein
MDDLSDTFDDIDDETVEMDFSSAFEDPDEGGGSSRERSAQESNEEWSLDDPASSLPSEADLSSGAASPSEAEEDDLERAMQSLFPVLPDERAGEATGDDDADAADTGGEPAGDEGDRSPSEAQFDAIKEDVQPSGDDRSDDQQSNDKKRKQSRSSDEEASTEEIEKIWSILEDME